MLQTGEGSSRTALLSIPSSTERQQTKEHDLDLINDPSATPAELREALSEAISIIDGANARVAILGSELASAREAVRERRGRSARGGRVGKARVYTQEEIEGLENERLEAQESCSRGRGRGRDRGRGCGQGAATGNETNEVRSSC